MNDKIIGLIRQAAEREYADGVKVLIIVDPGDRDVTIRMRRCCVERLATLPYVAMGVLTPAALEAILADLEGQVEAEHRQKHKDGGLGHLDPMDILRKLRAAAKGGEN